MAQEKDNDQNASILGSKGLATNSVYSATKAAARSFLTIHLMLSSGTRGLVGASEPGRMKATARLINTSQV